MPTATAATKTTRRTRRATATKVPGDFPGAAKIARILDGAKEHGWAAEVSGLDAATGAATVTVRKDGAEIASEFIAGKWAARSTYTNGTRKHGVRNVSAVLHLMAGTQPVGKPRGPKPAPLGEPELNKARRAARGQK